MKTKIKWQSIKRIIIIAIVAIIGLSMTTCDNNPDKRDHNGSVNGGNITVTL